MARASLNRAEGYEPSAAIRPLRDVIGFESAVAEWNLSYLVALPFEQPPGEVVRGVFSLANDNMLT